MRRKSKPALETAASRCICIELVRSSAGEVCIAGSFNEWLPSSTTMVPPADGRWAKKLTLPPGRYEYRFVVDGQWMDDRGAKEAVPNPFGGNTAVLVVEGEQPTHRPT